jgi:O-antigen ligase
MLVVGGTWLFILRRSRLAIGAVGLAVLLSACFAPRIFVGDPVPRGAFAYRVTCWQVAWRLFLRAPWLGWGPHSFVDRFSAEYGGRLMGFEVADASSHPMTVLAEQGLPGLILWMGWAWAFGRELARRGRGDPLAQALLAAFVGYLAGGLVLDNRFLAHQSGMTFVLLSAVTEEPPAPDPGPTPSFGSKDAGSTCR